jgi:hypothetical protein
VPKPIIQQYSKIRFIATNRTHLTNFLRAELMDPNQAALRMVRHFETKHELFGVGKLAWDITQVERKIQMDMYTGAGIPEGVQGP